MKPPLFVRPLADTARDALTTGLRSSNAFTLRRCLILLASARGERAPQIAAHLGCNDQTVRHASPIAARRRAGERVIWRRQSGVPKGSSVSGSPVRRFGLRWNDSACAGNGRNRGSPAPIRHMPGTKGARPTDLAGDNASGLGTRRSFRGLVEQDRPTTSVELGAGEHTIATGRANGGTQRPRPERTRLLWPVGLRRGCPRTAHRAAVAAFRGRATRERDHDTVPRWVLPPAGGTGGKGARAGVGQRELACEQSGADMDRGTQSGGQAGRKGRADRRLPLAHEASVAQPDRAEVDARQAADRGTGACRADGARDRGARLRLFRLFARPPPLFRRGLLIEH